MSFGIITHVSFYYFMPFAPLNLDERLDNYCKRTVLHRRPAHWYYKGCQNIGAQSINKSCFMREPQGIKS